jgi:diapolycopene oxygenase
VGILIAINFSRSLVIHARALRHPAAAEMIGKASSMNNRIVVIGAGPGGLSAAICLAASGWRVTVLEKNATVGGKMGEVCQEGFRWDTGPTVITLPHVFSDLFAAADRHVEDYLTLVPIDPLTRYFYPDGTVLDIKVSLAQTLENIEALNPHDVAGYLHFLAYAARMYQITAPIAIYGDPLKLGDILGLPPSDILQVDATRTMNRAIRSHVRSPYLRQLLSRFATYLGASPYKARAYLNVIAHVELTRGLWYPRGGTYAIARAYRRLAEELGVEIRTGARVTRILTAQDRVTGVELADGKTEHASAIIANVDPTTVFHDLLPEVRDSPRLRQWLKRPFSCSGFVMLLGIDRQHSRLAHHNIFFSSDYPAEFEAMFERGVPSQEPTIYVAITSKTDPAHAPQGSENWFVMANTPPAGPNWDWKEKAQDYRDLVVGRLADLGLDVRDHIRAERILTPLDIARTTGAWRGALYGHSFNPPMASFQRPHNRCPNLKGLYFAGGATHPGGGIPLSTLSGRTAVRMLLADKQEGAR